LVPRGLAGRWRHEFSNRTRDERRKTMKRTREAKFAPESAQPRLHERWWFQGAMLVLLVAVVYQPTLSNGFIWDDDTYVTRNEALHSLQGLSDLWFRFDAMPQYYPLVHTSFWVETQLWGNSATGYHAINMLLHAIAVLLVWRVLLRLAVPGAWLAAAIFAVHPVCVESVAWVTERKNVLSCALALGALAAYLQFSPPEQSESATAEARGRSDWRFYALALVLFVAALLSKTATVSVPAVILVVYWWQRGRVTWRDVARLAPFFAVGLVMAAVTVWIEKEQVGAKGEVWNLSPLERVLVAGRALWFYAGKLAWPYPLVFFYPRWALDTLVWWQYLYPAAVLAVLVLLWWARNRMGRGPLAAVLIFAGVLTPVLGFFDVYAYMFSFVADHFQYQACIALIAAGAAGLVWGLGRFAPAVRWALPLAAAAILMPLALIARDKTAVYRDLNSLYEDTIALNPAAWAAHTNLGYCLELEGRFDEAAARYREALRINPGFAAIHIHLGTVLFMSGHTEEATAELERALAGDLSDFNRVAAHLHYGIMLNVQGRFDDAIAHFRSALAIHPRSAVALLHYGLALEGRGEAEAGIEKVRAALAINPRSALAHNRLGNMLFKGPHPETALAPLRMAVQLQPTHAGFHEDLAAALLKIGDLPGAELQLRQVLELDPRRANAWHLLGLVFAQRGNARSAQAAFEAALKIDPHHIGAADSLRKARDGRPAGK
jgi:tetratricopeptide (TPR) repeat protein